MRRALVAALGAVVAVATSVVLYANREPATAPHRPVGAVSPAPRELTSRTDGFSLKSHINVVRGAETDGATLDALTGALRAAGIADVSVGTEDPGGGVTVWLAGAGPALARLGVAGATGLPAEGYVLATGQEGGRREIAIDGVDAAGRFYAVQTLRQLIQGSGGAALPGVAIRDWPAMSYRGSIEGFYGTSWTLPETLDHLDYLGAHKMNSFEYSPKDDPYLRAQWRDPLPAGRLGDLSAMVKRAERNHVRFTFVLSPGLSICFSSQLDRATLLAKLDAVYALGVRSFNIALDDIDYTAWHCRGDPAAYGSGPAGAARAQAALLNRVAAWAREKGDVQRLQLVPTEYYDVADSPYKAVMRQELDPSVIVMFTGVNGITPEITVAQVSAVRELYKHDVLIWENYPVNDYIPGRLPLAPYTGRPAGLSKQTLGVISNPATQAAPSEIGLYSIAAYAWRDDTFDPDATWRAALAERANGDQPTIAALEVLADACWFDERVHLTRAPRLAQAIEAFWQRWAAGDRVGAVKALRPQADALAQASERIRSGVADPAFAQQAKPWLDAAALWGRAMRAGLDLLDAQASGNTAAAAAARSRIQQLVAQAQAIRGDRAPHTTAAPAIADGVLDVFLAYVQSGFAVRPPVPTTTLGTYRDSTPAKMVDGSLTTSYSSDAAVQAGDAIGVDLGTPRPIGLVVLQMGSAEAPGDIIQRGALEYSVDGSTWLPLPANTGAYVRAMAPAGTTARFVRYRAVAANEGGTWVAVREFTVEVTT